MVVPVPKLEVPITEQGGIHQCPPISRAGSSMVTRSGDVRSSRPVSALTKLHRDGRNTIRTSLAEGADPDSALFFDFDRFDWLLFL